MSRYIDYPIKRHTTVMFAAFYNVNSLFVHSTCFIELTISYFCIIYICLVSTQSKLYAYANNLLKRHDLFLIEYSFHTQKGCRDYKAYHSIPRCAQTFLHSVHCFQRYLAGCHANL